MRRWLVGMLGAALIAGCVLQPPVVEPSAPAVDVQRSVRRPEQAAPSPTATPEPSLSPAPAPTAAPVGPDDSRKQALVDAIQNALAGARASRISGTLGQATGVLSNNAASLLSDKGLGYRVRQAPDLEPPISVTAGDLVYVIRVITETTGEFKTYRRADFERLPEGDRDQALVDHFTWDDVVKEIPYQEDFTRLAVAYHLKREQSKRIPFADRLVSREIFKVDLQQRKLSGTVGWDVRFAMTYPLVGAADEQASFEAVCREEDLVKVPASDGGEMALPGRLTLTGKNRQGTYAGEMKNGEAIESRMTHTSPAGAKSQLALLSRADGSSRLEIEIPAAKLRLTADADARQEGTGEVLDVGGEAPTRFGTLTWDAAGVATIRFLDGSEVRAQLF